MLITAIQSEDFPGRSYSNGHVEVYGAGMRSAVGFKRMAATRIDAVAASKSKKERMAIAEELQAFVWHLYNNQKLNQIKLGKTRAGFGE